MNMNHVSGRTGFNAQITGTIKEPYVESPVARINANLFYHYLDSTALDPLLYDGGKYFREAYGIGDIVKITRRMRRTKVYLFHS